MFSIFLPSPSGGRIPTFIPVSVLSAGKFRIFCFVLFIITHTHSQTDTSLLRFSSSCSSLPFCSVILQFILFRLSLFVFHDHFRELFSCFFRKKKEFFLFLDFFSIARSLSLTRIEQNIDVLYVKKKKDRKQKFET